jgi:hypothetical protein
MLYRLLAKKTVFIKLRRRRKKPSPETITVDNQVIQSSSTTRDLGILISDDLECSNHIRVIVSKAFRISNLILKIFKTKKVELFKKAFYSLVLPILEYASVVWNPSYIKDIIKIESVQRRFIKRAQRKCGRVDGSYKSRLSSWKIPTLEIRRLKIDLLWVYKLVYGYVDVHRERFFRINQTDTDIKIYPRPLDSKSKNNTQFNTIATRTYQIWNKLPLKIRNSSSVQTFKSNIRKYDLDGIFKSKMLL